MCLIPTSSSTLSRKDGNLFKRLRVIHRSSLANLGFLIRCRDNNIIPSFIKVDCNSSSPKTTKIIHTTKLKILRDHIATTRQKLASLEKKLYQLHLRLATISHPIIWNNLDTISWQETSAMLDEKHARHNRKFHNLLNSINPNIHHPDTATAMARNTSQISDHSASATYKDIPSAQRYTQCNPVQPSATKAPTCESVNQNPVSSETQNDECNNPNPQNPEINNSSASNQHTFKESINLAVNPPVINLSRIEITKTQNDILKKGLGFAITPHTVPRTEIVSAVEDSIKHLDQDCKQALRSIIKKTIVSVPTTLAPNITREERSALAELKGNKEIVITRADKGGATVILNKICYDGHINNILKDSKTYTLVKTNPINKLATSTKQLIKSSPFIPSKDKFKISPTYFCTPRIYALPKAHKAILSFRPIVSSVASPCQPLAKYLAKALSPLIGQTKHHISDTPGFINQIRKISLKPSDLMISIDVENLFTKTPVSEALSALSPKIQQNFDPIIADNIMTLTGFCVNNTFFKWQNKIFTQIKGLPMGSPLSGILADAFMEKLENLVMTKAHLKPDLWLRYKDDTFVIWPHGSQTIPDFMNFLNTLHEDIKFTVEIENNKELAFLDVLIQRSETDSVNTTVYRKKCFSPAYFDFNSCHHISQKCAIISSLANRALSICSPNLLDNELNFIRKIATLKNFPKHIVENILAKTKKRFHEKSINSTITTLKPILKDKPTKFAFLPYIPKLSTKIGKHLLNQNNIKPIYIPQNKIGQKFNNNKDPITTKESHGIYHIPCECGKCYIGQTRRQLQVRLTEHARQTRNPQILTSAVAQHVINEQHTILWEDTTILNCPKSQKSRNTRESIEIFLHSDFTLNNDSGPQNISFWKNLFDEEKQKQNEKHTEKTEAFTNKRQKRSKHDENIFAAKRPKRQCPSKFASV